MRSVILSFKFLSQFYHKETANFRIILHTLKTLGYEADVKFSSIHEIRSLESNEGEMEENLYLYNYLNEKTIFPKKFDTNPILYQIKVTIVTSSSISSPTIWNRKFW